MKPQEHPSVLSGIINFAVTKPVLIIIITVCLSIFFAFFAARIDINPDTAGLLPEDEEIGRLIEKYGGGKVGEESLVVAIETEDPFDPEILSRYYQVLEEISTLPGLKQSITPFNLTVFEKKGKRLAVTRAFPEKDGPPGTEEEIALFRKRLEESPFARNLVISEDSTLLCAYFPAEARDSYLDLVEDVREIVRPLEEVAKTYVSGSIPFVERMETYISRDFIRLLGFAVVIVLIMYFIGFRSKRSVILPTLVVLLGALWCIGFMSLMGFDITIISIITPPLVLTLGSSYSIHILNQYYREAGRLKLEGIWVGDAVLHVNRTVLMAAATTMGGIMSLAFTSLKQSREFAYAASFGIFACAFLSLIFFPAVLTLLKPPKKSHTERVASGPLSLGMKRLGSWVFKNRIVLVVTAGIIVIVFAFTYPLLEYNTDTISYFPDKEKTVQDMYALTDKLGGFDELKLTVTAPERIEQGFLDQEALAPVSLLEDRLREIPDISYVSSFVTYLKSLNQVMFGAFEIPEKRSLIMLLSRYINALSKEGEGDRIVSDIFRDNGRQITFTLRVYNSETGRFIDEMGLKAVIEEIEKSIADTLPEEMEAELWGTSMRYLSLARIIRRDLQLSMIISFLIVFIIAAAAFKSLKYGLFSLIPLGIGIMLNFILMTVFGIPLDLLTIMVSSVVIGVGVDDAIHYVIQFRRQWPLHETTRDVVVQSLLVSGRPIFLTTVAIVGGLSVLVLASFKPIIYFGLLVLFALSATCLGTLIFLPAFLSFLRKKEL